jgi:hypothetical protein
MFELRIEVLAKNSKALRKKGTAEKGMTEKHERHGAWPCLRFLKLVGNARRECLPGMRVGMLAGAGSACPESLPEVLVGNLFPILSE